MSDKTPAAKPDEMKKNLADGFVSALQLRRKMMGESSIDLVDVYFASLKLLLIAELPKGYAKMPPGYYTKRLVDALEKPNSATPHLSKQMELFANPRVGLWTKDPNALARGWLAIAHAIDADDEDSRTHAESLKKRVDSPYLDTDEAVEYLRLPSRKALYSKVERTCGSKGKRQKYKFTKAQLDDLQKGIDPWRCKS